MKKNWKVNLKIVRYVIFFLSLVIFAYTAQIIVQNINMNQTIIELQEKEKELTGTTIWLKKYYEPFLKSDYADYFFRHKSGIPAKNEILLKIVYEKNKKSEVISLKKNTINKLTWNLFFRRILLQLTN